MHHPEAGSSSCVYSKTMVKEIFPWMHLHFPMLVQMYQLLLPTTLMETATRTCSSVPGVIRSYMVSRRRVFFLSMMEVVILEMWQKHKVAGSLMLGWFA